MSVLKPGQGEVHEGETQRHVLGDKLDVVLAAAKEQGLDLNPDGNWWVARAAHGGILFEGPDVWSQQKDAVTPGVVVMIDGEEDGGASWIEEDEK